MRKTSRSALRCITYTASQPIHALSCCGLHGVCRCTSVQPIVTNTVYTLCTQYCSLTDVTCARCLAQRSTLACWFLTRCALDRALMAQMLPVCLWCARKTRPKLPVPRMGPAMNSEIAHPSYLCFGSVAPALMDGNVLMRIGVGGYACQSGESSASAPMRKHSTQQMRACKGVGGLAT